MKGVGDELIVNFQNLFSVKTTATISVADPGSEILDPVLF
jgi:hypothetical protein